jgi:branched-chain amino acid aminotransferase
LVYLGYGEMGLNPLPSHTEVMVACWPWGLYLGPEAMANGCRAMTSSWQHINQNSIAPQGKGTGQYVNSSLSKVAALKAGYDEAVLLSPAGNVVQGTGENIFIVQGRTVVTPPIQEGLLAGITRDSVMTIARDLGYEVVEHALVRTDLYMADEAFFTGTAAEIVPIASVDDRNVGTGRPGPVAKEIMDVFSAATRGEVDRYKEWNEYVGE